MKASEIVPFSREGRGASINPQSLGEKLVYGSGKITLLANISMKYGQSRLDIRRELVVFDTHLDTFDASLQELAGFQASPDLKHGKVARPQRATTALGAELAKDGKCAIETI